MSWNEVYNWQLGRKMDYPYPEAHPKSQFAFVFNINRCIACQTCTMACKSTWTFSKGQEYMWWNNVETKPFGGYPQFWDMKVLQLLDEAHNRVGMEAAWDASRKDGSKRPYGVFGGMTIFEAAKKRYGPEGHLRALGYIPRDEEWRFPNIYEDSATGLQQHVPWKPGNWAKEYASVLPEDSAAGEHKTWHFYLQRLCNHCTYPACLAACPRKAIYKRPEDGIVLIDQERCRGYRKCVEACPYKKPMFRGTTRVSEKCIACYPRIEGKDPHITPDGAPIETRCMTACVGKIRMQGLVKIDPETGDWAEDRYHPLYFLVKVAKVALPLYPQFGTEPNGYYIPPRWAPRPYLRQMFGPGVDEAIERYVAPSRELLAVLQLFRAQQKIIFRYEIKEGQKVWERTINGKKWEMYDDTVMGFDNEGRELVKIKVMQDTPVRSDKHQNSI